MVLGTGGRGSELCQHPSVQEQFEVTNIDAISPRDALRAVVPRIESIMPYTRDTGPPFNIPTYSPAASDSHDAVKVQEKAIVGRNPRYL